ncbi:hypothetical protein BJX61DRAFT_162715 [Aspergillus egyptiacus]|nr:hypothetical protein BJX61DRAFT_162715 [Aspergillus egyptiacus]
MPVTSLLVRDSSKNMDHNPGESNLDSKLFMASPCHFPLPSTVPLRPLRIHRHRPNKSDNDNLHTKTLIISATMQSALNYGNFAGLPYDIREQIWFEVARNGVEAGEQFPSYASNITSASKDLGDGISSLLFKGIRLLNFDISSTWTSITWTLTYDAANGAYHPYRWTDQPHGNISCTEPFDGFVNFPFNLLDKVVVTIEAPLAKGRFQAPPLPPDPAARELAQGCSSFPRASWF